MTMYMFYRGNLQLFVVIVTGNPGVSQGYPYPYPQKPLPPARVRVSEGRGRGLEGLTGRQA